MSAAPATAAAAAATLKAAPTAAAARAGAGAGTGAVDVKAAPTAGAAAARAKKTVAVLVFPGFTVLDAYGPIQAFAMAGHKRVPAAGAAAATAPLQFPAAMPHTSHGVAGAGANGPGSASYGAQRTVASFSALFDDCYRLYTVGAALPWTTALGDSGAGGWGPVTAFEGPATHAAYRLQDVPLLRPDVLLIPGGFGTRALVNDSDFVADLKAAAQASGITATVCTGAALLAATGLLDGVTATSNKLSWAWVTSVRGQVKWQKQARWVSHVNPHTRKGVITSSGVSAGIDMALHLIEALDGMEVAERAAQRMEYEWRNRDPNGDPFVNSKL